LSGEVDMRIGAAEVGPTCWDMPTAAAQPAAQVV